MIQILLIFAAMAAGLATGRLTGGFAFSSLVCIVAGVLLVTPSLLGLDSNALRGLRPALPILARSLVLNLGLTAIALALGWATADIGIAASLLLLAMLPGGGMVMHWVAASGADVRTGFLLSLLHLALVLPVTLVFAAFPVLAQGYFPPMPVLTATGLAPRIPPLGPFMVLAVLPWVLSRWLRDDAPRLLALAQRHRTAIARATIAGIVFYLFALTPAQQLFTMSAATFGKALAATLAFYAATLLAARLAPRSAEGRALGWFLVTRYITLALILAGIGAPAYGPGFILPVMLAYPVQFALAAAMARRLTRADAAAGRSTPAQAPAPSRSSPPA